VSFRKRQKVSRVLLTPFPEPSTVPASLPFPLPLALPLPLSDPIASVEKESVSFTKSRRTDERRKLTAVTEFRREETTQDGVTVVARSNVGSSLRLRARGSDSA